MTCMYEWFSSSLLSSLFFLAISTWCLVTNMATKPWWVSHTEAKWFRKDQTHWVWGTQWARRTMLAACWWPSSLWIFSYYRCLGTEVVQTASKSNVESFLVDILWGALSAKFRDEVTVTGLSALDVFWSIVFLSSKTSVKDWAIESTRYVAFWLLTM